MNKNKKQLILLGASLCVFALLAFMMINELNGNSVTTNDPEPVRQDEVPPPVTVKKQDFVDSNKAINTPEIKVVANTIGNKLLDLRKEQLDAAIETAKKLRREAENTATKKKENTEGRHSNLENIPKNNQPNFTGAKNTKSTSDFDNATLNYFDYKNKKAFLKIKDRSFSVYPGINIGTVKVVSITKDGVRISSRGKSRLLTAPKTYSIPASRSLSAEEEANTGNDSTVNSPILPAVVLPPNGTEGQ